ncbi:MAG: VOC family protein [Vicinamibacterales bacterium]
MKLDIYLNYHGNCEEAFRFYVAHLGASGLELMRHSEVPDPSAGPPMPEGWGTKVLHARIELGGTALMGADVPSQQPIRSAYLTLTVDSTDEADRVYALLTDGGEIFMPMAETFYAHRFAMFRDRFGTSWMLLHPKPR